MKAASLLLVTLLVPAALQADVKGKLPYPCGANAKFSVERSAQPTASFEVEAPRGMGVIVVVSDGDGGTNQGIAIDGEWIGAIHRNGGYFSYAVTPGEHRLCSTGFVWGAWGNPGFLMLTVEPGHIYYINHKADYREDIRRFTELSLVDELQGHQHILRQRRTEHWEALPVK